MDRQKAFGKDQGEITNRYRWLDMGVSFASNGTGPGALSILFHAIARRIKAFAARFADLLTCVLRTSGRIG
jgi:hypothetical protein